MSQEEARKLLDAWAFFDKHPEAKSWEGMPRPEFYRLVQIIAGTDNLVDAKEYFEGVAAGTITGDMPTALLEAQKEGQDVSKRLSTSKSASKVTKNWLAKLNVKSSDEVAEKQVAAAQVRAVIERAEEETPATKTVVPSSAETPPSAPATAPPTRPPAPSEGGIEIKISSGAFASLQQLAGKATATPLTVISLFSPPTSSMSPQASAAFSSALTLSQIAQKAENLQGVDREFVLSLVDKLGAAQFSYVQQAQFATQFLTPRTITILNGPEMGMDQGSVVALLGGGRGIPERGPSFVARVGQQLFGSIVKKAASKAIAGALTKTGISVAGKAIAGTVGQAAIPIPGVGFIVGQIVGWIANKAVELASRVAIWIKEHSKEVVGSLLIGGGILIGGFTGLAAGIAGGAIALGGSGLSTIASGIGSFFSFIFTGIILPSIGIPILVALFTVPAVIVIILFIINSGAYVVPPSSFSIAGENPYIGVVKEVSPSSSFENSDLPISVTYKISVTAKRGTLSNITFEHKCQVVAKSSTFDCPAPLPDSMPKEISPVGPYVYTYNQTYAGANHQDSLVINTFTVTADAPESQGSSSSGTASIIIGNPPTGCYNVAGSWPASEKANIMSAISTLVGNYPHYVGRLCSAWSQVNLYYESSRVCGAWACAPGGNVIYFNSGGLGSAANATYILAHESGHVLAYGMPSLYQSYLAFPGTLSELPVCTYGGSSPAEGFAEGIARYAARSACLNNEPNNKAFVETQIFR